MSDNKQKPTKRWLEDQIQYHKNQIILNQGSINLLEAMLKTGVYVDELDIQAEVEEIKKE